MTIVPNANRRQERAKRARETINKVIPDMLRSSPKARHGIHRAELVVAPDANTHHGSSSTPTSSASGWDLPKIRLQCTDTLAAAARLSDRPFTSKRTAPTLKTSKQKPNVAVLNMASPLKPGGGFLDGANSQEEFICARTTLYPSLWDSFYRLPELGGVWTPDVLVFRDSTPEANELVKRDRYFVDVISAGMLRFPDVNRSRSEEKQEGSCSCGVSYCDRDRELVTRKMKSVMRLAQSKDAEKLVLGAWGCGAYGNPVKEVAKIWRKVIAGSPRQRRPNAEKWEGIKEIVFAIPDRAMLKEFQNAFSDVLATDLPSPPPEDVDAEVGAIAPQPPANDDKNFSELVDKIQETELQLEQMTNARSKARLRDVLANLNSELARGLAAKQFKDDSPTQSANEEAEDEDGGELVLVASYESNGMYHFDENDVASSTDSGCETSELYEFRPSTAPGLDSQLTSHDEADDDSINEAGLYDTLEPSPRFDAETGWFSGSIDEFHGFLKRGGSGQISHASPVLRPEDNLGGQVIDELVLEQYLGRYDGSDAKVGVSD